MIDFNHEGAWQGNNTFEAYKKGERVSFERDVVDGGVALPLMA
jgi:hypothetical protein